MMKKAWKYRMIPVALMLLLSGCGHFTELVEHVASKQETTAEETQAILETTIPAEQVVEPADSDAMRIELSQRGSSPRLRASHGGVRAGCDTGRLPFRFEEQ